MRVARAPGADPGGVVAYEYEQRIRPYLTEKTWFSRRTSPRSARASPCSSRPASPTARSGRTTPAVTGADLENQRFRWEMKDTQGSISTTFRCHPHEGRSKGRMTLHYAGPSLPQATDGTWKEHRRMVQPAVDRPHGPLRPRSPPRLPNSPPASRTSTPRPRHRRVLCRSRSATWRSRSSSEDTSPTAASEIFHNRYGDCKDKATLVAAMLSSIGEHAALVIVDTERERHRAGRPIHPRQPCHLSNRDPQGLHLAAAPQWSLRARTGKTIPYLRSHVGEDALRPARTQPAGSYGVLMEGSDSQAIEMPVLDPRAQPHRPHRHLRARPGRRAQGHRGREALRRPRRVSPRDVHLR